MPIQLSNPPGIPAPEFYRQVAVATGSRTVYLAGQVARTAEGQPVGAGDLAAQVEQAYLNIATALAAVGGSFADVVRLTAYVVDWTPDKTPLLLEGVARAGTKLGATPVPPFTGIGVSVLASPDLLVEVEATALLD